MTGDPHKVGEILDSLAELGTSQEDVAVADVVARFGQRSYGPFLLVPSLIGISPLGAIPGIPAVLAAILALFAVQILFGRSHLWLPGMLGRRKVAGKRLVQSAERLGGVGAWMDKWFHGRIKWLVMPPVPRIAAAIVLLMCLLIPPLEFLPFAVFLPMGVVAAVGMALMVKDGVLMLAAFLGTGASFMLAFSALA